MFLYSTVSTLNPIVGIVVTISPSLSLYKMVVLPAASRPTCLCFVYDVDEEKEFQTMRFVPWDFERTDARFQVPISIERFPSETDLSHNRDRIKRTNNIRSMHYKIRSFLSRFAIVLIYSYTQIQTRTKITPPQPIQSDKGVKINTIRFKHVRIIHTRRSESWTIRTIP